MDLYGILGIPSDADQETIRDAYKTLALRYHPDRGVGSSTEKFRQIAQAYETLIDPGRRQGYDLSLLPARRPAIIRVGPTTASGRPLYQEHPDVFGRFKPAPNHNLNVFLNELEDDFFGPWWRW